MKATHGFSIDEIPRDPYAAEKFLMEQIKQAFSMAHQSDMTRLKDFNMIREICRLDPFGKACMIHLEFDGDSSKTFATTTGSVTP